MRLESNNLRQFKGNLKKLCNLREKFSNLRGDSQVFMVIRGCYRDTLTPDKHSLANVTTCSCGTLNFLSGSSSFSNLPVVTLQWFCEIFRLVGVTTPTKVSYEKYKSMSPIVTRFLFTVPKFLKVIDAMFSPFKGGFYLWDCVTLTNRQYNQELKTLIPKCYTQE